MSFLLSLEATHTMQSSPVAEASLGLAREVHGVECGVPRGVLRGCPEVVESEVLRGVAIRGVGRADRLRVAVVSDGAVVAL